MGQVLKPEKFIVTKVSASEISLGAGSVVTIGGQQYMLSSSISLLLSGLTVNSLYMVYAVMSSGVMTLVVSANVNSVGPSGYSSWKLVSAFYAASSTTAGNFVNIGGTPITDWQAYTPTTSGITVGNGTLLGLWRRSGDSIEVKNHFIAGSTSANTGQWSFLLPTGFSFVGDIDTRNDVCAGTATWLDSGLARYLGGVRPSAPNAVGVAALQSGSTKYDDAGSGGPAFTTSDTISLIYTVKIAGWSITPLTDL